MFRIIAALFLLFINNYFAADKSQPNVILILTDDQGYGDISSNGNRQIQTPHMDRIADNGARFESFFVSPLCAPTRASLLTGRYHIRTGAIHVSNSLEIMRSDEITIAEIFKANGYETGCFGKWHNGEHYPNNANGQGFDEFIGFSAGHLGNYFNPILEHNSDTIRTNGYITDILTNKAIEWIEENKDNPFFCYIPYNAPHTPYQVPDKYYDKYAKKGFDVKNATIYGMVENLDENIGRLLSKLESLQLDSNTIVVFLTDNGPNTKTRFNAGMKGMKASVDEGGVRVPLFIQWPSVIKKGTTYHELSAHIDILPTLIDLCSLRYNPLKKIDGKSLKPLLDGSKDSLEERIIFTHRYWGNTLDEYNGTARSWKFRYVLTSEEENFYDMINDPGQMIDIKELNQGEFNKLKSAYNEWFSEVSYGWKAESLIPVGFDVFPKTTLQAVEAQLAGALHFHGEGYAHDWIENWRTMDDSISWAINISNSGLYQISLNYVCPEIDLGSEILIQIGDKNLKTTITDAYDPELFLAKDREKRYGVLEKPWKKKTIGNVFLEKGIKKVILSADKIPGRQVIELRNVELLKLSNNSN